MSYQTLADRSSGAFGAPPWGYVEGSQYGFVRVAPRTPGTDTERRVQLIGEIDQSCTEVVRTGLARLIGGEDGGRIVVDCSELRFIDSSGLRMLLSVAGDCERQCRPFAIVNLPSYFARLVARLSLETSLHVEPVGMDQRIRRWK
jgi:anti-sigma B factor antagonist